MNYLRTFPTIRIGIVASYVGAIALVSTMLAKPSPSAPAAAVALNGGAIYIGEADCLVCHGNVNKQFSHTLHADVFRLNQQNEKETITCEACHGPGSQHSEDTKNRSAIVGFTKDWGPRWPNRRRGVSRATKGANGCSGRAQPTPTAR